MLAALACSWKGHTGNVKCICRHAGERLFFTGSKVSLPRALACGDISMQDSTVRLWSPHNLNCEGMYTGHREPVTRVQLLPRRPWAVSLDTEIHVWDFEVPRRLSERLLSPAPAHLVAGPGSEATPSSRAPPSTRDPSRSKLSTCEARAGEWSGEASLVAAIACDGAQASASGAEQRGEHPSLGRLRLDGDRHRPSVYHGSPIRSPAKVNRLRLSQLVQALTRGQLVESTRIGSDGAGDERFLCDHRVYGQVPRCVEGESVRAGCSPLILNAQDEEVDDLEWRSAWLNLPKLSRWSGKEGRDRLYLTDPVVDLKVMPGSMVPPSILLSIRHHPADLAPQAVAALAGGLVFADAPRAVDQSRLRDVRRSYLVLSVVMELICLAATSLVLRFFRTPA
eukprot:767406-Hanusia_phi.AAC.5